LTPVTFGQASLYFAQAWLDWESAYNTSISVDVHGPVSDCRLAYACRTLYRGTAALRLRMGIDRRTGDIASWFDDGEPDIEQHDCWGAGRPAVAALVDSATRRSFDADEGAMTRFLVVRTGADTATLALVFHHLVSDGSSHRELTEQLARSVTEDLPPDDGRVYTGLVRRVREAELAARRADRDYWFARITSGLGAVQRSRLGGPPPAPVIGRQVFVVDGAGMEALDAVAAATGASRFRLLIASIHRALPLPGAGRSVVCTAAAQRPPGPGPCTVGCFINQVPLVATRRDGDTAATIAEREGGGWREDLRRRYFPFTDLARRADSGEFASVRLDSVMVGYRTTPRALRWRAGDVICSADLTNWYGAPKTELSVRFFDHGNEMQCEVEWRDGAREGAGQRFAAMLAATMSGQTPESLCSREGSR
jgi:hypothetical protein